MKGFCIFLLLLSVTLPGLTQTITTFGQFLLDELTMPVYEKDPDAEAVVISDIGTSSFNQSDGGFELVLERSKKIKIFSRAGYKYGEVSIPYYHRGSETERVYDIEAYTYNIQNGGAKITPLDKSAIYDEKVSENWSVKKFAMPDVSAGCVIEFRYKLKSPFHFNLTDWEFQSRIPTILSKYTVRMIPFYEYQWIVQGTNAFDIYETYPSSGISKRFGSLEYQDMVHVYGMKDVPAFKDEEYITSINDYVMKLDFQLSKVNRPTGGSLEIMTTWPKMIDDFMKSTEFGKYQKKANKHGEKELQTQLDAIDEPAQKLKFLVEFVRENYSWDGYYGKFANKTTKEFLREKTGNIGSINLFLCGLIRSAGLNAYPVILSTRGHGKIKSDYPFQEFFNYVIVLVELDQRMVLVELDQRMVLVDGTALNHAYDQLPVRVLNDHGLIIKEGPVGWVNLTSKSVSTQYEKDILTFSPSLDTIKYQVSVTQSGYDAIATKNKLGNDQMALEEEIDNGENILISPIVFDNANDPEVKYSYDIVRNVASINEKIYISPFQVNTVRENPLKQDDRKYPIDMIYSKLRRSYSELYIPEGWSIDYLPKDYFLDNEFVQINYKTFPADEKIGIQAIYYFKQSTYPPKHYKQIKNYYEQIVTMLNDKIVLKRE